MAENKIVSIVTTNVHRDEIKELENFLSSKLFLFNTDSVVKNHTKENLIIVENWNNELEEYLIKKYWKILN